MHFVHIFPLVLHTIKSAEYGESWQDIGHTFWSKIYQDF